MSLGEQRDRGPRIEPELEGVRTRMPVGARIALALMSTRPSQIARVPRRLAVLVPLAIGFAGWFATFVSSGVPGTIVNIVVGPLATGALGAAIGRGQHLAWLLLGFALPPIVALASARLSPPVGETSGFAFVEYSMIGLVLVSLGFYGWRGVRRVWTASRRDATRGNPAR